ncbi:ABC transporter ATP-binding protein [Brochothrix thermosphacta]|uniref:ABC transporter ATP-binding protein n=1 Tax=Brochothrix thermosphacta TaxID=2756 RepID=UPI0027130AC3|nr:ABC transporter ATP-binding protein [Brochothrix thermosphacta]MDO7863930.1 ABC transporter ATP-binding protein [Brochothrix thermosphacta]
MSYIEFKHIRKTYDGQKQVLNELSLSIEEGHLVTLLGPSGCGKSTLLRALAGFETIDGGEILINGKNITKLEPGQREIGMVFQQYSLFPNMTVEENIAFGLKMSKVPKVEREQKVAEIIAIVDLVGKEKQYPQSLSGGQKQRVALARAIVTEPKVLLLDEPLSAIDAMLRKSLQKQIRRMQKQLNITTIFVTHDQDEAMILSDVVHVMNEGQIEQSDHPTELYTQPKTKFVASFMGNYNILEPRAFAQVTGQTVTSDIAIRPEVIDSNKAAFNPSEEEYTVRGRIVDATTSGNILSYYVEVEGVRLRVDELYRSFNLLSVGDWVHLRFEKRNCLSIA